MEEVPESNMANEGVEVHRTTGVAVERGMIEKKHEVHFCSLPLKQQMAQKRLMMDTWDEYRCPVLDGRANVFRGQYDQLHRELVAEHTYLSEMTNWAIEVSFFRGHPIFWRLYRKQKGQRHVLLKLFTLCWGWVSANYFTRGIPMGH